MSYIDHFIAVYHTDLKIIFHYIFDKIPERFEIILEKKMEEFKVGYTEFPQYNIKK